MAELIVALDLTDGREAVALASRLPGLRWVKLGPVLYVRSGGRELVREFTARGVQVFLDLKWHDIPSTVAGAVTAAKELGVAMATVHCLGGRAMLEAAAAAAGPDLPLVGVTVLTSHDAAGFEAVLGRGVPDLGFEAERLGRVALQAGLRGLVASGHELGLLREALGAGPWLVVPGIRPSGDGDGDGEGGGGGGTDQSRTIAPADAVRRGASHLVVGRPITASRDPVGAYQRIVAELG